MMHEDDLPGYLVDAINAAVEKDGLASLTLHRVGTSRVMWQAGSRCSGDDAYRVAIENSPFDAIFGVLGPRKVPGAAVAAEAEDLFG